MKDQVLFTLKKGQRIHMNHQGLHEISSLIFSEKDKGFT